jgi:hypothetical protein
VGELALSKGPRDAGGVLVLWLTIGVLSTREVVQKQLIHEESLSEEALDQFARRARGFFIKAYDGEGYGTLGVRRRDQGPVATARPQLV